jgi:hypothetical protein
MSKCPFWSTGIQKVECYEECPMDSFFSIKENCPFKEHLVNSKISIKGIQEYDYVLNEDSDFKLDFITEITK